MGKPILKAKKEMRDFEALRRNQIPSSSRSSSFFTSGWAISLSLCESQSSGVWRLWRGLEVESKEFCVCVCIV